MAWALPSVQPSPQGLYDARHEHDACGVAFVATLTGVPSHTIVDQALTALRNLEHRGASGAEPDSGDGAGLLVQVPDAFLRAVVDFELPAKGSYAVGNVVPPVDAAGRGGRPHRGPRGRGGPARPRAGATLPTAPDLIGSDGACRHAACSGSCSSAPPAVGSWAWRSSAARSGCASAPSSTLGVYFASLSARTLVYKGMLTTGQLEPFFPDLSDERFASALALVHSRFSTNTFPSWPLAHPYRYIAHNGEINTVRGNRNWMRARESLLASDLIPGDLSDLFPICTPDISDSASFDEALELLHLGGRSLPHAVLMMIPEAWENHPTMDPARRAFYQFHATLMEPWDGPACVTFTDGTAHRRGPRPQRPAPRPLLGHRRGPRRARLGGRRPRARPGDRRAQGPPAARPDVPRRHRGGPHRRGRRDQGRARRRAPLRRLAARRAPAPRGPARARAHRAHARLGAAPPADLRLHRGGAARPADADGPYGCRADRLDGHRLADRRAVRPAAAALRLLQPAVRAGHEPAAGRDPRGARHLAGHAHRPRGQPPRRPGRRRCRQVVLPFPVIDNDELAKILHVNADGDLPGFAAFKVSGLYPVAGGGDRRSSRGSTPSAPRCRAAIATGSRFVVLSDRDSGPDMAPIPSLLLTSAVHHHLTRDQAAQPRVARSSRRATSARCTTWPCSSATAPRP